MESGVIEFLTTMGGPGVIIIVLLGVCAALWRRLLHVQDRELSDSRAALKETADALRDNARALDSLALSVRAGGRNNG